MLEFTSDFPIFLQPGESAHLLCTSFRSHAEKGFHSAKVATNPLSDEWEQFFPSLLSCSTSFHGSCPTTVLWAFSRSTCTVAVWTALLKPWKPSPQDQGTAHPEVPNGVLTAFGNLDFTFTEHYQHF